MTTDITDRATKNLDESLNGLFAECLSRGYTTVNAACAALGIGERRPLSEPDKARLKSFLDSRDKQTVNLMLEKEQSELIPVGRSTMEISLKQHEHYKKFFAEKSDPIIAAARALEFDVTTYLSHFERGQCVAFVEAVGHLDEYNKQFNANAVPVVGPEDELHGISILTLPSSFVPHDPVNHPTHYTQYKGMEIIDLTEQMNFNLGNAVKYITRAGFKDPDKTLEDLKKSVWYIEREMERLTRND